MKLKERLDNWVYNWPWWWILIPLSPFIIFVGLIISSTTNSQPSYSVWLQSDEVLVVTVDASQISITTDGLEPEGCTLTSHSNNLSKNTVAYLSCKGTYVASFNCAPSNGNCEVTSVFPLEIKKK